LNSGRGNNGCTTDLNFRQTGLWFPRPVLVLIAATLIIVVLGWLFLFGLLNHLIGRFWRTFVVSTFLTKNTH
jgi:hypothetical protein